MQTSKFDKNTIITAERGKYLALAGAKNSEETLGIPVRIIFDNKGIIPEFEEKDIETISE